MQAGMRTGYQPIAIQDRKPKWINPRAVGSLVDYQAWFSPKKIRQLPSPKNPSKMDNPSNDLATVLPFSIFF